MEVEEVFDIATGCCNLDQRVRRPTPRIRRVSRMAGQCGRSNRPRFGSYQDVIFMIFLQQIRTIVSMPQVVLVNHLYVL